MTIFSKRKSKQRKKNTKKKRGGWGWYAKDEHKNNIEYTIFTFFTQDILDAYKRLFMNNNNKYAIMTYRDIVEKYGILHDRIGNEEYYSENEKLLPVVNDRIADLCDYLNDSLDTTYAYNVGKIFIPKKIQDTYEYTINKDKNYDAIIIKTVGETPEDDYSRSVLVTEKGSCYRYPNIHIVKLMCSREPGKIRGNISASTLALKCYTFAVCYKYIIERDTNIFGLLELAKGYRNIKGICFYSKFGFKTDPSFYSMTYYSNYNKKTRSYQNNQTNSCFDKFYNLPMKFDVDQLFNEFKASKDITKQDEIAKLLKSQNDESSLNEKLDLIREFMGYIERQQKDDICDILPYVKHGYTKEIINQLAELQKVYAHLSQLLTIVKYLRLIYRKQNININYLFETIDRETIRYSEYDEDVIDHQDYLIREKTRNLINMFAVSQKNKILSMREPPKPKTFFQKIGDRFKASPPNPNTFRQLLYTQNYFTNEEKELMFDGMINDIVSIQNKIKNVVVDKKIGVDVSKEHLDEYVIYMKQLENY